MLANRALRSIKSSVVVASLKPNHGSMTQLSIHREMRFQLHPYSTSKMAENQLIIGGMALAGSAMTLKYALTAYENYKANQPAAPTDGAESAAADPSTENTAKSTATEAETTASSSSTEQAKKKKAGETAGASAAKAADSIFASWFARGFYDGGFEEKMTKREAALILGIRESATVEKVKEAHRRVLLLNHPDRGGSVFIAAKINEAKDLLLKGRA